MIQQEIFSPQEIHEFQRQGCSDLDIQTAITEAQKETSLQQSYRQAQQLAYNDPRSVSSNSLIASSQNNNLIQWQLELDSILERIEHMLRGDKPTWQSGSIIWKSPEETYILRDNNTNFNLPKKEELICELLDTRIGLTFKIISEKSNIEQKELRIIISNLTNKKIIEIDDGTIL